MSFDIHYHTCNLGARTTEQRNPLTGKMQPVPVDDGLTDAERSAVLSLIQSAGADAPDAFGYYAVGMSDGGMAEVFAPELGDPVPCNGLMVSLRGLTPALARFLWELGRAGNMVAIPVMEGEVVAVVNEDQRSRVHSRWPEAMLVESPDEFARLLSGGLAAWQVYRDQVTGT